MLYDNLGLATLRRELAEESALCAAGLGMFVAARDPLGRFLCVSCELPGRWHS